MNTAHLHLWIHAVPVVASVLAALLVGAGLVRRDASWQAAGLLLALVAALGAVAAYRSGVAAEPIAAGLVDASLPSMAEHRQRAVATVWLAAFSGVVAAAALLALARGSRSLQAAAVATALALLVLSAVSATWTAAAGHRIRHAEISMTPPG